MSVNKNDNRWCRSFSVEVGDSAEFLPDGSIKVQVNGGEYTFNSLVSAFNMAYVRDGDNADIKLDFSGLKVVWEDR